MSMTPENEKSNYIDSEKHGAAPVVVEGIDLSSENKEFAEELINAEHEYTDAQYKKLMRKVDFILMPLLMLTYGLQYSDKGSLASGVVFGLRTDTGLVGLQYSLLSVWFYLAYAVAQMPMNWIMQRAPIGKAVSISVIIWGGMVLALGGCNNYAELSVVRAILGWFEAVVTPGFLLIVSSWYLKRESTSRQFFYYSMNTCFATIFGVIIYFIALSQQEKGGVAAWRVINFFLGSLTVVDGILLYIFIGTPETVWWLSKDERRMARARIVSNQTGGGEQHPWKWEQVTECLKDPQYWHAQFYNVASTIPNGGLGAFSVLVYQSFGFTNLQSILYGLPSNAIGFVTVLLTAWAVTKIPRTRFPIGILCQLVPIIVFLYVGLAPDGTNKWQLWACFSFVSVFAVTTFLLWSIIPINTAGRTKKSFMSGSSLISYCAGNICGSLIFLSSDAPKYPHALTACAVVMSANTINIALWWWYYVRENKRRETAFIASGMSMEEREHLSKLSGELDVTDRMNPHFRYTC